MSTFDPALVERAAFGIYADFVRRFGRNRDPDVLRKRWENLTPTQRLKWEGEAEIVLAEARDHIAAGGRL